jgi:L-ascorbate metabolism protein UlaG (beta-lactamase superfamily)
MRLTWLGHATVVIETAAARIITDPVLRDRMLHLRRHSVSVEPPAGVDMVLISHLHHDHLDMPSLRKVTGTVVGPHGTRRVLRNAYREVSEVKPGDELPVGDARVMVTRAVHDGRRYPVEQRRDDDTLGFIVEAGGARVYFAGDTELFDEMRELGSLDLALIPIWGWGTRLGPGHMDPRQAAEAVARIAPAMVVPIHWGTYFPIHAPKRYRYLLTEPAKKFREQCAELAPDVRVEVIEPGNSLVIPPG